MTFAQIREKFHHISEEWRSETADEKKIDLADLDDMLGKLDEIQADSAGTPDTIDELRARIEILMDEIDISLGIEPPPLPGLTNDVGPF